MAKINPERFYEKIKDRCGNTVTVLSEFMGNDKPIDIVYHCKEHGDTYSTINAKNIFKNDFCPCKSVKAIIRKSLGKEEKVQLKSNTMKNS